MGYINASVDSVVGTNNSFTVIIWIYPLTKDYVTVNPPNDTAGWTYVWDGKDVR